jgi:hypothetical protein
MMSSSLKKRVNEKTIEKQMSETSYEKEISGSQIISIEREKAFINVVLQSDKQLLDHLFDYLIGLDDQVFVTSDQLNMESKKPVKYFVLSAKFDKSDKIKKIKLRLKVA